MDEKMDVDNALTEFQELIQKPEVFLKYYMFSDLRSVPISFSVLVMMNHFLVKSSPG